MLLELGNVVIKMEQSLNEDFQLSTAQCEQMNKINYKWLELIFKIMTSIIKSRWS